MESSLSIFEEEFISIANERTFIILADVIKMNPTDDNNLFKINFMHIHDDKDGRFTLDNFKNLSDSYHNKKEVYKEYEFTSRLQAYFTLLMWKQVCSNEGEKKFVQWIKTLIIQSQLNNQNDSEDEINLEDHTNTDLTTYIDKYSIRLLYDILNVKLTHCIDFQSFFDLLQASCIEIGLIDDTNDSLDNYIHKDILDIFSKNFIRGFSKLIIDLGFDTFLLDEIQ